MVQANCRCVAVGGGLSLPPSGPTLPKLQGTDAVMMHPFMPPSWPAGLLAGLNTWSVRGGGEHLRGFRGDLIECLNFGGLMADLIEKCLLNLSCFHRLFVISVTVQSGLPQPALLVGVLNLLSGMFFLLARDHVAHLPLAWPCCSPW